MRTIFVVLVLVALGQALPNYEEFRQEWNSFKSQHSKTYKDVAEDLKRLKLYLQTKEKILKHNKLYKEGKSTFFMALNQFADMLPEELHQMMPPLNRTKFEAEGVPYSSLSSARTSRRADSMDWRWSGAVTRVKNQGGCGSCWSFATTGALETRNWRKSGHLVDLSEQNLLDCSRPWGPQGCNGGWPHDAFRYVIENRGIDNEWSYPYEGYETSCRFNQYNVGATAGSYAFIQAGNENQLADAVSDEGPVAIAFDSNHDSIMYYGGGVIHENNCNPNVMAHAVTLVGYGYDPSGGDYWLLKNSWGEGYGEGGYLRLARNRNNMCGIATVASFPLN